MLPVVQTEEYMDTFNFEMAGLFCQRALDVESDNLQALDMLGHICSELGDVQKAKGISFQRVFCLFYTQNRCYLKSVMMVTTISEDLLDQLLSKLSCVLWS